MHSFSVRNAVPQAGLASFVKRSAVASAIGAGMLLAASSAAAQVIHSGPISLSIPVTTAGIYLNVVTGISATTPGGAPGWDLNPWSSSGLSIWANNSSETANGVIAGNGTATQVDNLPMGYLINGANTFVRTGAVEPSGAFGFSLNSTSNLIGFRFTNAPSGTVHFGWARIGLGATLNNPSRAILEYAFELTPNTAIQAGVVPEPGTYALMGLGLAGVLLMARRRRAS